MKIRKPSRRFVVLIVMLAFSFLFIALVKLPLNFDDMRAREVNVRAGKVADTRWMSGGRLDVRARGTERHTRLGLSRKTAAPYRFKLCTDNKTLESLTLTQAKLDRLEDGQYLPIEVEFNLSPDWPKTSQNPLPEKNISCIGEFIVLDFEIESQDVYCVEISFDLIEDKRVEQTCIRFTRNVAAYRVTLWELFVGYFVYSA